MSSKKIDDVYSECFSMWYSRILITAYDKELALAAANNTIGFATSIIMCSAEAGIEKIVSSNQTPDGRPGVIIQIWTKSSKKMKAELLARLSQCALTAPTTAIFSATDEGTKTEPIGKLISYFGDGYQRSITKYNKTIWEIPVMDGLFYIEENFHMSKGVAGGVLILVGEKLEDTLQATRDAIKLLEKLNLGVITSFPAGICRAGSKIGSKYSFLNESTNHQFCPTLKGKIQDSFLPTNGNCAYEIVINAISQEELQKAMKEILSFARKDNRIIKVTSANYEGKLGTIIIKLRDLLE